MNVGISVVLDIYAIVVLASCILLHIRKLLEDKAIPQIGFICIVVFAMLLTDLIYVATCILPNTETAFIAEQCFFILNAMVVYLWGEYISTIIYGKQVKTRHAYKLFLLIFVLNIIFVFANFPWRFMFRIGTDGVLDIFNIGYSAYAILNWISVIFSLVLILNNKRRFRDGTLIYIYMFLVPSIIAEVLTVFLPNISFISFYTISVIMLLNVFQKYKEYKEIDRIIDQALEHNQFTVAYQPIYSLTNNSFTICEALLRITGKDNLRVRPDEICSAAEESGKIAEIGNFVINEVCIFIKSTEFSGLGIKHVNINMSMQQMKDPYLYSNIMNIVNAHGVDPANICFEVTETVVSGDTDVILTNMNNLHSEGFTFALDDYGSAHSNLYRIATFPFTVLKIDRAIVQQDRGKKTNIIISNTVQMAKDLDMYIVAEGVETVSQLEDITSFGVDFIQGWYFSKALPKSEFIKFISMNKK